MGREDTAMDLGDSRDSRSIDSSDKTDQIPRRHVASGRRIDAASQPRHPTYDNWGLWLIHGLLYPFAMVATPLFLLGLIVYFVFQAFSDSTGDGVRSFAAVLLPLMTLALLVAFRKEKLQKAEKLPSTWAFFLTLAVGIGVLALLAITPTGIPLPELVLSGSFSVLIFSYVALSQDKAMFYYFGMVLGFLLYVVILGFPTLRPH
jgi:hypothetical protein